MTTPMDPEIMAAAVQAGVREAFADALRWVDLHDAVHNAVVSALMLEDNQIQKSIFDGTHDALLIDSDLIAAAIHDGVRAATTPGEHQ